jgi:RND family efflux transporter MFP subunit
MRKVVIIVLAAMAVAAGSFLLLRTGGASSDQASDQADVRTRPAGAGGQQGGGRPGGMGGPGGFGPGGAGAMVRPPMTVEVSPAKRAEMTEQVMIVGSLIGAATVDVAPKIGGRLQAVDVRIGDKVARGQKIAQIEDREILEQVKQAQAAYGVSQATIRQREADLSFAKTNLDRSRNLFGRQLISQQTLDDAESRYQAAVAQLDLARAQFDQSGARLDELKINLANTVIASPVDGFVGKRNLDAGAWASTNIPVASVVDIHLVRLIVNLVEKDLRRVSAGMPANVDVDAYPGESFAGRVARVAPVLDPATRTAQMEVEVPNDHFRLKPGMYARVRITVDSRANALVIPRNALVDIDGKRGVFLFADSKAAFRSVETGLQGADQIEIVSGLADGDRVVTTGAAALRDGDRILLPGQASGPGSRGPGGPGGRSGGPPSGGSRPGGTRPGTPPAGGPRNQPAR